MKNFISGVVGLFFFSVTTLAAPIDCSTKFPGVYRDYGSDGTYGEIIVTAPQGTKVGSTLILKHSRHINGKIDNVFEWDLVVNGLPQPEGDDPSKVLVAQCSSDWNKDGTVLGVWECKKDEVQNCEKGETQYFAVDEGVLEAESDPFFPRISSVRDYTRQPVQP